MINLASFIYGTSALGPGKRSVIWVQGCPFSCQSCYAQDWIPFRKNLLVDPIDLANTLVGNVISGITISGGEPFAQPAGVYEFIRAAKKMNNNLTVIIFSGYRYNHLLQHQDESVGAILNTVDVLIDGPYIEKLNDGLGLRGSTNQHIIHLSEKLVGTNLTNLPRSQEFRLNSHSVDVIGIPTKASMAIEHQLVSGMAV